MGQVGDRNRLRFLHLEDDPRDTEIIEAMLNAEGIECEIRRVATGDEFQAALDSDGWALIISDYSLPAFDGLRALSMAQKMKPGIPFILFSGTIGEETAIESLKRGAADYILKQRPKRLVAAIRHALDELDEKRRRQKIEAELHQSEEERKHLEAQCLRMQRMESIGALVGGIAHDLNNALVPILVGVDYIRSESLPPDSQHMLATMRASARRGADMIRQVLAFARGTEGKEPSIKLSLLVREMERIIRDIFPKAIRCKASIAEDLWPVSGSPTQLHQVLMNLCVNARDAMPEGGLLSLAVRNMRLTEADAQLHPDARPGPYVVLAVADTGTGMPPEVLEKIFQPFFTTKEPGKGTGLGLSTTVNIVKTHGGFVTVKSEIGKGSDFNVYYPAAVIESGLSAVPSNAPLMPGHGELILVVDDETAICEITKITLENYGYRVLVAGSGPEAVALFAERRNDVRLAITDTSMPFMDGRATCLALRKLNPQLKVIAASGEPSRDDDTDFRSKISAFIQKPYTVEKLLTTVHHVLSGKPG